MKAKWLYQPVEKRPPKIVCEALRAGSYACDLPKKNYRCTLSATVNIDGRNYCRRHAGQIALLALIEGNDVAIESILDMGIRVEVVK